MKAVANLIGARESHTGEGLGATSRYGELAAGEVELSTTGGTRAVEGNVLNADEVVAGSKARRDSSRHSRVTVVTSCGGSLPSHPGRSKGRAILRNLKPDVAGAVKASSRLARGYFSHVPLHRTRMLDLRVDTEPDLATGGDSLGLWGRGAGVKFVASKLRACHILDGTVALVVGCLADVSAIRLERNRVKNVKGVD